MFHSCIGKARKHITFDESDGEAEAGDELASDNFTKNEERASSDAFDDDDEAPETISIHDQSIQKLKELHDSEALVAVPTKHSKKKKASQESASKELKRTKQIPEETEDDVALGDDVLTLVNTIGADYSKLARSQEEPSADSSKDINSEVIFRIDTQPRSRKMYDQTTEYFFVIIIIIKRRFCTSVEISM